MRTAAPAFTLTAILTAASCAGERPVTPAIPPAPAVAAAPIQTGAIAGTITDNAGRLLPGATVVVVSGTTSNTVVTNQNGHYQTTPLAAGPYQIEARVSGFEAVRSEAVLVEAGQTVTWNASLRLRPPAPGPARDEVSVLRSRCEAITGPNPLDCGQHLLVGAFLRTAPIGEDALGRSLECGVDAAARRQPFSTFRQLQGIDSWVANGLIGTADGTIQRFSWDSAPCGLPGQCTGRLETTPCRNPSIANIPNQGGLIFICLP